MQKERPPKKSAIISAVISVGKTGTNEKVEGGYRDIFNKNRNTWYAEKCKE